MRNENFARSVRFKAEETFMLNPIAQLLKCHWKLSRFGYILQLSFCFSGKVVRLGNFPCSRVYEFVHQEIVYYTEK